MRVLDVRQQLSQSFLVARLDSSYIFFTSIFREEYSEPMNGNPKLHLAYYAAADSRRQGERVSIRF
jgi:hypothetical protein